ncbi:MAG: amino acid ABC transporter permease [bacterium]|nr:amino acid ABC transporter permease [bacterium]
MVRAIPLRRPWLWLGSAVVVALAVVLAVAIYRGHDIHGAATAQLQFGPAMLRGLQITIVLAVLSEIIGIALGILLAVMRLSPGTVLRLGSGFYVWLFRGTPLLVQILIWGNLALLFEYIGPFKTTTLMTPFVASVVALGLNEGAYMAEIMRAGIVAVDRGQLDASLALGMSSALALRRIVLPQALRAIVSPAGNQFISLLKATSLVSVIAGGDLLTVAENISPANLRSIELTLVAALWYLVLTTVTSVGQYFMERRLGRGGMGIHAGP